MISKSTRSISRERKHSCEIKTPPIWQKCVRLEMDEEISVTTSVFMALLLAIHTTYI